MFSFIFAQCVVMNVFSWYSCKRPALLLVFVFVSISGCVLMLKKTQPNLLNLKKTPKNLS